MTTTPRRAVPVVLASAVLVVLAGLLVARIAAQAGPPSQPQPAPMAAHASPLVAPPATVPPPAPIPTGVIPIPCWSCPDANTWPLQFRTDLDMLAPLGTGEGNAGVWYADFAKDVGPRSAEASAAQKRRTQHPKVGMVLPPDDPLLREAEPWVDQATMRFYPDVFKVEGFATRIPNLLIGLTFARSWIARGMDNPDSAAAMADFRRAVRLGRLLRQDDVTIIADLVGLACIRIGAEAIYERAALDGNDRLALVAAIVAGEAPPQKLLTAARVTECDFAPYFGRTLLGKPSLSLPDAKLDKLIERAKAGPDRRMRGEPLAGLGTVRQLGSSTQKERATQALEELSHDADPIIAAHASFLLAWEPSSKELSAIVGESLPNP